MDVRFRVTDRTFTVPERQATILAENLRLLANSESDVELYGHIASEEDWRTDAWELADSIEEAVVGHVVEPLTLKGRAAEATHDILRLMIGLDTSLDAAGPGGLRDALGSPVSSSRFGDHGRRAQAELQRFLSKSELVELLVVLFALAVLTVIAAGEGFSSWYLIAPVIAALLGLRVATTRVSGKIAWSLASVVWFAVLLVPATLLVLIVALVVVLFVG